MINKVKIKRIVSYSIRFMQLLISWIILNVFRYSLIKKNIWLIREKRDEARDNGYHFYKYLRENHPEINAYFVITADSPDRYKIEKYDNIIEADSWEHCIYFLAARFSISSQQYGAYPFHFNLKMLNWIKKLCNRKQKVVFLQHGIIQNQFHINEFLYSKCNIDYFVTSTKREYEFVKETYKYPDYAIGCVGMPRFDYLHQDHQVENTILIMPTWRRWLDNNMEEQFVSSDYFKSYAQILSDNELRCILKKYGYKLIFYIHYKMQPYLNLFKSFEDEFVVIADKMNYDVQSLLMSSKVMVTDYSSVFFDFAYMNKPIMYYQFDVDDFHKYHYEKGYFSYEDDGFGPCFNNWTALKTYIINMVEHNCNQQSIYDKRVKAFFNIRDNCNCQRVYDAIIELDNKKY